MSFRLAAVALSLRSPPSFCFDHCEAANFGVFSVPYACLEPTYMVIFGMDLFSGMSSLGFKLILAPGSNTLARVHKKNHQIWPLHISTLRHSKGYIKTKSLAYEGSVAKKSTQPVPNSDNSQGRISCR